MYGGREVEQFIENNVKSQLFFSLCFPSLRSFFPLIGKKLTHPIYFVTFGYTAVTQIFQNWKKKHWMHSRWQYLAGFD